MASLFFSYSHKDEALRDQLEVHLSSLKRQGFIESWHDRQILAGQELKEEIDAHLENAQIILLLISPDFIASDYCYSIEMQRALQHHKSHQASVIPVILRPCDWHDLPFGKLMATSKDGKAITQWANTDEAFLDVTLSIKSALQQYISPDSASQDALSATPQSVEPTSQFHVRSSNLRISKQFTEHDRDNFLQGAFDFIAKYFEGSMDELSKRNPEVQHNFRRIDANRFTAIIYRNGQAVSECTVFLGGQGFSSKNIGYSDRADGNTQTLNSALSVESDEQKLYLQPSWNTIYSSTQTHPVFSYEGGAEYLWEQLVGPLQRT